jgi:hypothetical protein
MSIVRSKKFILMQYVETASLLQINEIALEAASTVALGF